MDRSLEVKIRKGILKELGLLPKVAKENRLYYSENSKSQKGILYWVDNYKGLETLVKRFEAEFEAKVYHCILNYTADGTLFTLLYVSNHEEEWELDRTDLREKEPLAYVYNLGNVYNLDEIDTDCVFGELGTVGIIGINGGFNRTF